MISQPHNLIRHPEMPRAVFALLWSTLAGGEVEQIQQACEEVSAVMDRVGTTVSEMNGLVDGIAAAVDGSASLGSGAGDITALSQMAERLRSEATGFLAEMRR
ncbi:hypothetical protein [Geodermatophilus sp. CPCC 206100]|uniref:hypothetical protein n=1 Tax=Geodermatophilus sp. CPCC 206100 TaxID=3020054 RepID=UPI003B00CC51